MTDNPFVHPTLQGRPRGREGPLRPASPADSWYIQDVGGHAKCLEDFQAAISPISDLRSKGRLVVVEGPPRSGKTSLINHCRHILAEEAHTAPGLMLWDFDRSELSTTETAPDGSEQYLPAAALRRDVCRAAVVMAPEWLDSRRASALDLLKESDANNVPMVYTLISGALGGRVAQIVLPKAELDTVSENNLELYDRWMVPGMIFFAERTITPTSPKLTPAPATTRRDEMLILRLHNLSAAETARIVARRLASAPSTLPPVDADVFSDLADRKKDDDDSIGYIVELFTALYEKRISGGSRYPHLPSIQWPEVTDYIVRFGGEL